MDRIEEQIRERLGDLISAQMAIYTNKEKDVWPFIERRDALRSEIADDWRARDALVAELVEAVEASAEWAAGFPLGGMASEPDCRAAIDVYEKCTAILARVKEANDG